MTTPQIIFLAFVAFTLVGGTILFFGLRSGK